MRIGMLPLVVLLGNARLVNNDNYRQPPGLGGINRPEILVRGDDLWINASVSSRTLAEGGRIAIETPVGRRIVWLTRKAGERKLVRLVGQGLPARGPHRQGHLFLRLAPAKTDKIDSAARTLLRRFAAAWAA